MADGDLNVDSIIQRLLEGLSIYKPDIYFLVDQNINAVHFL